MATKSLTYFLNLGPIVSLEESLGMSYVAGHVRIQSVAWFYMFFANISAQPLLVPLPLVPTNTTCTAAKLNVC
jgi:hypothetical protein